MAEKIEVRTTSGGFIEVTRCEGGVVWVDIKRGDGTTGISGRLDGDGPRDLARALHSKSVLVEGELQIAKSERDRYERMYLVEVRRVAELDSGGHGAYQKLNDELAKAKAEVAKWEKEAFLRAGSHERLLEYRAFMADGDARSEGTHETWKERDARHRATIHQLKQENHNLRTKREEAEEKLRVANRRSPYQVLVKECPTQAEAAHVVSLTKQLADARSDVKAMQKEVYDLKLAGKICAEAMQEWRTKLAGECGFTYPNLVNIDDILKEIRLRVVTFEKTQLVKQERDDLQAKVDTWRKNLTDALQLPSNSMFNAIATEIRHLKTRPKETHYLLLNGEGERTIAVLRAQVKAADQLRTDEVKRCSDRVKELEQRCFDIEAIATGRKS